MNVIFAAPIALLALLAIPTQVVPLPTPSPQSEFRNLGNMTPSEEQLLDARVAALERQVTQLESDMKLQKTHTHTLLTARHPSTYMSIHDLSVAMQPHSNTPTTQYYVPLVLSPSSQPGVDGVRETTSSPVEGQ